MPFQNELCNVMRKVAYVQKDGTNAHFKYRYASAEAVLKKVNEALYDAGICILETKSEVLTYARPEAGAYCQVRISWTLAKGEERATFQGIGEGSDKGDKSTMKASTAALKYLLSNAFCISWGDDPEADATTDQRAEAKPTHTGDVLPPPEKLLLTLSSAAAELLPELKKAVLSYRGTEAYDKLRTAYKERETSFNGAS